MTTTLDSKTVAPVEPLPGESFDTTINLPKGVVLIHNFAQHEETSEAFDKAADQLTQSGAEFQSNYGRYDIPVTLARFFDADAYGTYCSQYILRYREGQICQPHSDTLASNHMIRFAIVNVRGEADFYIYPNAPKALVFNKTNRMDDPKYGTPIIVRMKEADVLVFDGEATSAVHAVKAITERDSFVLRRNRRD